jgi:hypothetical protein
MHCHICHIGTQQFGTRDRTNMKPYLKPGNSDLQNQVESEVTSSTRLAYLPASKGLMNGSDGSPTAEDVSMFILTISKQSSERLNRCCKKTWCLCDKRDKPVSVVLQQTMPLVLKCQVPRTTVTTVTVGIRSVSVRFPMCVQEVLV